MLSHHKFLAGVGIATLLGGYLIGQTSSGSQSGSSSGGAGTSTGSSSRTTSTTRSTTTTPSIQSPSIMDIQRPMMLTGRLMMDDGMAPPESVQLLLICNGQARVQGYSDGKGRFGVTLGQAHMQYADASMGDPNDNGTLMPTSRGGLQSSTRSNSLGMSERELMSCEFRADLPGFRSDIIPLSGRRLFDNPDVGTIVLHRMSSVQGYTFSMSTAAAPKDARKAYDKGTALLKKGKPAEAESYLRAAVTSYPKYAVAWLDLGRSLELQKKYAAAETAYTSAIGADPKFLSPHLNLLQLAVNKGDWPAIAERSDTVLGLNPFNFPSVWFVNGAAHFNLKHNAQAEKSAREALRLDTGHQYPRAARLLGEILSDKGDYAGALDQLRAYVALAPDANDVERVRRQIDVLERTTSAKMAKP